MNKNISKIPFRPPKIRKKQRKLSNILTNFASSQSLIRLLKNILIYKFQKRQVSREQMKRELDVWGQRQNIVPERPYTKSKKQVVSEPGSDSDSDSILAQGGNLDDGLGGAGMDGLMHHPLEII